MQDPTFDIPTTRQPEHLELTLKVVVDALRRYRSEHGTVPNTLVYEASLQTGVSTRQLRRLVKSGLAQRKQAFTPTVEHMDALYALHGNATAAYAACIEVGLPLSVGVRQFQRGFAERADQALRRGASEGWSGVRNSDAYLPRDAPQKAHTYAIDHTQPPVLMRPDEGHGQPWLLWETSVIDEGTRFVLVVLTSEHAPNVDSTAAALALACQGYEADNGQWVGGSPQFVLSDNGPDLRAHAVTRGLVRGGVKRLFTAPRSGNQNGKVERVQRTVQQEWCAKLPGYLPHTYSRYDRKRLYDYYRANPEMLLTYEQYKALRFKEQMRYNYERPHSQLDGRTPLQAWTADETFVPRADPDALRLAMMCSTTRVVDHGRVRFDSKSWYSEDGVLAEHDGRTVEVRYMPGNEQYVEVFYQGAWVCRAWSKLHLPSSAHAATTNRRAARSDSFLAHSEAGEKLRAERVRKELAELDFADEEDLPAPPQPGQAFWSNPNPGRRNQSRGAPPQQLRRRPESKPEVQALLRQYAEDRSTDSDDDGDLS